VSALKDAGDSTDDQDDVGYTTNEDAEGDSFVPSKPGISEPGTKYWNNISQESKKEHKGVRELQTLAQSTCCLLCAFRWGPRSIAASGKGELHKVREYVEDTIVRGTFRELYCAKSEGNRGNMVSHSSKCGFFFLCRKRIVGVIDSFSSGDGLNIMTLRAFVVVRLANSLDGSVGASAMRLSQLWWDTGREDGLV
jgi:hypothetical protein